MDTVTQALLGAAAAEAVGPRPLPRLWLYGALGGLGADLDVLIRSADPLVPITFHRHFTHSLAFIPVGGLALALPFLLWRRWRGQAARFGAIYAATTVGYATHAILDAFTSYGTLLLWPFSSTRIAWNVIGIIDLGFSVPLALGVWLAARRRRPGPARAALVIAWLYVGLCACQRGRAVAAAERLAAARGHAPDRAEVFPTVFNHVTWRSLYAVDGRLYADRIRVPWAGGARVEDGASIPVTRFAPGNDRSAHALATLRWFAMGWLGSPPDDPHTVGDLRYSMDPGGVEPLWGLRFSTGDDGQVDYTWFSRTRRRSVTAGELVDRLFSDGPDGRPI